MTLEHMFNATTGKDAAHDVSFLQAAAHLAHVTPSVT